MISETTVGSGSRCGEEAEVAAPLSTMRRCVSLSSTRLWVAAGLLLAVLLLANAQLVAATNAESHERQGAALDNAVDRRWIVRSATAQAAYAAMLALPELADSDDSEEMDSASHHPPSGSSSVSSDDDDDASDVSSSGPFVTPLPTPKPPDTTPSPPRRKLPTAANLALLALIVLVIPAGIALLIVWCVYRRNRYRRRIRSLRLNGTRHPGEVDDVGMGQAVKGGDWLNLDTADGTTAASGGIRRSRFSTTVVSSQSGDAAAGFDPIGQQAADARTRKRARRVAVAAAADGGGARNAGGEANRFGNAAGVFGATASGQKPGPDVWSSDDDEETEDVFSADGTGGPGGGAALAPVYATTLVLPINTAPTVGADGVLTSPNGAGGGNGGAPTTVVPPLTHNPRYFNETAKVLLERYNTDNELSANVIGEVASVSPVPLGSGGRDRAPSAGNTTVANGSVTNHNTAFEHILSSAVAPLRLGQEFHQRGRAAEDGAAPATQVAAVNATPAPRQRAEVTEDEEGEEEEEDEEEGEDEEHDEEGVFQDEGEDEEEEGEFEEDEEESEPPLHNGRV